MKENILKYKNFIGTVQYSADDVIFYGRIDGIDDLVSFRGSFNVRISPIFNIDRSADIFHDMRQEYWRFSANSKKRRLRALAIYVHKKYTKN